ncbi:MAG: aldolase [Phycisphaeraceae bacterium]|nr:aldolase [Phycisphaeraceae bacterium]
MTGREFAAALRNGDRLFGTLIVSTSPAWPKVMHRIGLDYVFIDTEHIAISRAELSWMCRTYGAMGLPPVVRVPAPDPYQVTMALDDAAAGVMVPYIETVEQARELVGATKYRPLKGRKLRDLLSGRTKLSGQLAEYIRSNNAGHSLILNIESVPAMENLEQILSVEGIDGIIIGPHDLSTSLGLPEQYDHPDFTAAVDTIIDKAKAAGVSVGIHGTFSTDDNLDQELRWIERGANLVLHSGDIIAFENTMRRQIGNLRAALNLAVKTKVVLDKINI